jgi:hypothetical protein
MNKIKYLELQRIINRAILFKGSMNIGLSIKIEFIFSNISLLSDTRHLLKQKTFNFIHRYFYTLMDFVTWDFVSIHI